METLLQDQKDQIEVCFAPKKRATVGIVRFRSAAYRDTFFELIRQEENATHEGRTLYWNPDRSKQDRAKQWVLGKIKKYLYEHNAHEGVELFTHDDVDHGLKSGVVWIKRDRVVEVVGEDLTIKAGVTLETKYHIQIDAIRASVESARNRG